MLDFTICKVSLWSYINQPDVLPNYLNCLYDPNAKVIWPSVAPISLVSNQSKATQGIGILSGRMTWTLQLFKRYGWFPSLKNPRIDSNASKT